MEDASSLRPLSVQPTGLKVTIAFLEQEVVINELLAIGFRHLAERVELASQLTFELVQSFNH